MAETALSIITEAFRLTKIYAPGVQLIAADAAQGLSCLNRMLDVWSNKSLICFANKEDSFTLVPNKNRYTIGATGADITSTRPIKLLDGMGSAYVVDGNNNRYPARIIDQGEWNSISNLVNTSQIPDTIFYDAQFPLGVINVYPTPSVAYTMYFDTRMQLEQLSNLNSAFSLPPGYGGAIIENLAVALWPYYKQGDPPSVIVALASFSLGALKSSNLRTHASTYDASIISRAQSSYNIYNDTQDSRGGT